VLTADCLPLLVASDDGREVAAIHAGWRGLAAGVIEATLRRFEASPDRLRVWLGPAIDAASYEVGDEVRDAFVAHDPAAAQAFEPTRPGHWLCDLVALARLRLAAFGVVDVAGGGFDTLTDERFYSHRRNRPTGRFASLIWIEPAPTDAASPLLFPRLLGAAFARLPPRVRSLHLAEGLRRYRGAATITRGTGLLSRLCGWATGLPSALTDAPLDVDISAQPDGETWTRRFGRYPMTSRLWAHAGLLSERLGLVTFRFALAVEYGVLTWRVRRVGALGVPLPAAWFAGVYAREFEQDGRYRFEVAAALPLAGELVHYAGWLDVD
ncbi:MAG TPA: laccase domain-containing protein, partial [Tahibacter sp.]|nr:laccase domain-containing protein [Tahibacter sp.]